MPGYGLGDVIRWRDAKWRPTSWTKDGVILERVHRHERTGASWRDLEHAVVLARHRELTVVDVLSEDSSAAEILDPMTWKVEAVALPWDHESGSRSVLARIEGEWLALPRVAHDRDLLTKGP